MTGLYAHGIYEIETPTSRRTVDDGTTAAANGINPDGSELMPPGKLLGINDNGAFFNATNSQGRPYLKHPPGPNRGNDGGNNPRAQADTLLHELAHLVVGQQFLVPTTVPRGTPPAPALLSIAFLHDSLFVNPGGQNNNRQLLTAKCGNLILTFPAQ
jgi:hypothetical protein